MFSPTAGSYFLQQPVTILFFCKHGCIPVYTVAAIMIHDGLLLLLLLLLCN
jgi:hypothetical protein